jgi:hypothetical protein
MCGGIALGDSHHPLLAQAPVDGDLSHCFSRRPGYLGECAIGITGQNTLKVVREWTMGDDCDSLCLTVFEQIGLDGAIHHVVADLIRDDRVSASGLAGSLELREREITDADEAHFAGVHELLHSADRLVDWHLSIGPMKLIEVDPIRA